MDFDHTLNNIGSNPFTSMSVPVPTNENEDKKCEKEFKTNAQGVRYLSTNPGKNHDNFEQVRDTIMGLLLDLETKFNQNNPYDINTKNINTISVMKHLIDKMNKAWETKKKNK